MTHFSKFAWEDLKCPVKAVPDHPIKSNNPHEHKAEKSLRSEAFASNFITLQIIDTNVFLNVRKC